MVNINPIEYVQAMFDNEYQEGNVLFIPVQIRDQLQSYIYLFYVKANERENWRIYYLRDYTKDFAEL